MANDLQIEITVDEKGAVQGLDKLASALKKIKTEGEDSNNSFSKLQASLVTAGAVLTGLKSGVDLVAGSFRELKQFLDLGDLLDDTRAGFTALGGTTEAINSVKDATKGLITETQAYQLANRALLLQLPDANKNMAFLADAGTKLAQILGRDVTETIDSMYSSLATGRPIALQQLGIFTDLEKATADYAKANNIYGRELTQLESKEAARAGMIEAVKSKLETLPDVTLAAADQAERLGNAILNLTARFSAGLGTQTEFTQGIGELTNNLNNAGDAAETFGSKIARGMSNVGSTLSTGLTAIATLGGSIYYDLLDQEDDLKLEQIRKKTAELNAEYEKIRQNNPTAIFQQIFDSLASGMNQSVSVVDTKLKEFQGTVDYVSGTIKKGIDAGKLKDDITSLSEAFKKTGSTDSKQLADSLVKLRGKFIETGGDAKTFDAALGNIDFSTYDKNAKEAVTVTQSLQKLFKDASYKKRIDETVKGLKDEANAQAKFTTEIQKMSKQYGESEKDQQNFINLAQAGAEALAKQKTSAEEVEEALKKAFGDPEINRELDNLIFGMGELPKTTSQEIDMVRKLIPELAKMGITGDQAVNQIIDRLDVLKDKQEDLDNQSITGENFLTKFLGIDDITKANAESALASTLADAYSNAINMAVTGNTSGADIGALAGTAIGMAIGAAISGGVGAAVGGQAGGTLGSIIGESFENDTQWTTLGTIIAPGIGTAIGYALDSNKVEKNDKTRRQVAGLVEDVMNEMNFQIMQQGQLVKFDDIFNLDFQPGSSFLNVLDSVGEYANVTRDAFGGVLGAYAAMNGLDFAQGFQEGQSVLLQFGGDIDNLRLLVAQLGISFDDAKEQIMNTFLQGEMSALEYENTLTGLNSAYAEGLVAVGDLSKATQMLQQSAARGQVSVTSLRNVAIEGMEQQLVTVEDLQSQLINMGELSTSDIGILYQSLKDHGIQTLEDLKNASDDTIISILATMEANQFSFSEALTTAQDQITDIQELIDDLPESITTNYQINVSSKFDSEETKTVVKTMGNNFPGMATG